MSVRIDIVNYALSLLGADAITSIEDDASEAKVMKSFYPLARNGLLELEEWSFAIKRFVPAESTVAPLWQWGHSFPIPSDVLRVLTVDRDTFGGMNRSQVDHVVENQHILCNETNIYCTGIRLVKDEGIFSALFAEAMAMKLAMLACYPITESNSKLQSLGVLYAGVIKEAKSRNGQSAGTTRRMRSRWLDKARR